MNKKPFCNVFFAKCSVFAVFLFIVFDPVSFVWAHYLDQNIIENARQATVGILKSANEAERPKFTFRGTGVHVGDGYIITARHVVSANKGADVLQEISILTSRLYELTADIIGEYEATDTAVYRLSIEDRLFMPPKAMFGTRELIPGDDVFAIGNSLDFWMMEKFGHTGNINRYVRFSNTRLVQLDIPICSGDSGGGVFNEQGELVGITTGIIATEISPEGAGCSRFTFSTPLNIVKRVFTQFIDGKKPRFSLMGVGIKTIRLNRRWVTGVESSEGPALKAGIRPGDIIVSINGREILDAAQLKSFVTEETNPGDTLSIRILREGKELEMSVITGGS